MWQMETELIPVVIDTLGVIKKELENMLTRFQAQPASTTFRKLLSSHAGTVSTDVANQIIPPEENWIRKWNFKCHVSNVW